MAFVLTYVLELVFGNQHFSDRSMRKRPIWAYLFGPFFVIYDRIIYCCNLIVRHCNACHARDELPMRIV